MSSNEKSKTIIQLLREYGYEETYDNEIPHYVHYNISQENALRAFKEWLEQKKENYDFDFTSWESVFPKLSLFDELIKEASLVRKDKMEAKE